MARINHFRILASKGDYFITQTLKQRHPTGSFTLQITPVDGDPIHGTLLGCSPDVYSVNGDEEDHFYVGSRYMVRVDPDQHHVVTLGNHTPSTAVVCLLPGKNGYIPPSIPEQEFVLLSGQSLCFPAFPMNCGSPLFAKFSFADDIALHPPAVQRALGTSRNARAVPPLPGRMKEDVQRGIPVENLRSSHPHLMTAEEHAECHPLSAPHEIAFLISVIPLSSKANVAEELRRMSLHESDQLPTSLTAMHPRNLAGTFPSEDFRQRALNHIVYETTESYLQVVCSQYLTPRVAKHAYPASAEAETIATAFEFAPPSMCNLVMVGSAHPPAHSLPCPNIGQPAAGSLAHYAGLLKARIDACNLRAHRFATEGKFHLPSEISLLFPPCKEPAVPALSSLHGAISRVLTNTTCLGSRIARLAHIYVAPPQRAHSAWNKACPTRTHFNVCNEIERIVEYLGIAIAVLTGFDDTPVLMFRPSFSSALDPFAICLAFDGQLQDNPFFPLTPMSSDACVPANLGSRHSQTHTEGHKTAHSETIKGCTTCPSFCFPFVFDRSNPKPLSPKRADKKTKDELAAWLANEHNPPVAAKPFSSPPLCTTENKARVARARATRPLAAVQPVMLGTNFEAMLIADNLPSHPRCCWCQDEISYLDGMAQPCVLVECDAKPRCRTLSCRRCASTKVGFRVRKAVDLQAACPTMDCCGGYLSLEPYNVFEQDSSRTSSQPVAKPTSVEARAVLPQKNLESKQAGKQAIKEPEANSAPVEQVVLPVPPTPPTTPLSRRHRRTLAKKLKQQQQRQLRPVASFDIPDAGKPVEELVPQVARLFGEQEFRPKDELQEIVFRTEDTEEAIAKEQARIRRAARKRLARKKKTMEKKAATISLA